MQQKGSKGKYNNNIWTQKAVLKPKNCTHIHIFYGLEPHNFQPASCPKDGEYTKVRKKNWPRQQYSRRLALVNVAAYKADSSRAEIVQQMFLLAPVKSTYILIHVFFSKYLVPWTQNCIFPPASCSFPPSETGSYFTWLLYCSFMLVTPFGLFVIYTCITISGASIFYSEHLFFIRRECCMTQRYIVVSAQQRCSEKTSHWTPSPVFRLSGGLDWGSKLILIFGLCCQALFPCSELKIESSLDVPRGPRKNRPPKNRHIISASNWNLSPLLANGDAFGFLHILSDEILHVCSLEEHGRSHIIYLKTGWITVYKKNKKKTKCSLTSFADSPLWRERAGWMVRDCITCQELAAQRMRAGNWMNRCGWVFSDSPSLQRCWSCVKGSVAKAIRIMPVSQSARSDSSIKEQSKSFTRFSC